MTRDSLTWALGIAAALVTFLVADGRNPIEWAYLDWVKFAAAVIATISGKLASSPLKHSSET